MSREQRLLVGVRYVLPALIVVAGLVVILAGGGDGSALHGGLGIVGGGIAVWLLSLFYRVGASGELERDAEEDARLYFDRHGRWPEEDERLPGKT
ncbi:MAG TPA: hypothetical protein VF715_17955 [Thermoleophilaceae bacterium]|jgi:hypothetical protein